MCKLQMSLLLLVVGFAAVAIPMTHAQATTVQDDCLALIDLFAQTSGSSWSNATNWNMINSTNCCDLPLFGVGCDAAGRVSNISLPENNLNGTLPQSLGRITYLSSLCLSSNSLTGPWMMPVVTWANIRSIDLSGNLLTGVLPSMLAAASNSLIVLNVARNQFTGLIPSFLAPFQQLQVLDLSCNRFLGSIPSFVTSLRSLTAIRLFDNAFSASPIPGGIFTRMPNLTIIQMGGVCHHPYGLPDVPWNCPRLKVLDLTGARVGGPLPAGVCSCINLEQLDIPFNSFSGHLPECIGSLTKLNRLSIAVNRFEGAIPDTLRSLTQLRYFTASDNQFTTFPRGLLNISTLLILDVSSNYIVDEIPRDLHNMTSLIQLDLSYNSIYGMIPPEIGRLSMLENIYLENNNLVGEVPNTWHMLKNLSSIDVSSNNLNGSLPNDFANFPMMRYLKISRNQFSGRLTSCIFILPNLESLDVSGNNFTGSVDSSCPYFSFVKSPISSINLSNNRLHGPLPDLLCRLENLRELRFSSNMFTSVPDCIVNLNQTLALMLASSNRLNYFPWHALQYLPLLNALNVANNSLGQGGPFPMEIFKKPYSLSSISLAYNNFSGPFNLDPCDPQGLSTHLVDIDISGNQVLGFSMYDPLNPGYWCGLPYAPLTTLTMSNCSLTISHTFTYYVYDPVVGIEVGHVLETFLQDAIALFPGLQSLTLDYNPRLFGGFTGIVGLQSLRYLSAVGTNFSRSYYDDDFLALNPASVQFSDRYVCYSAVGASGFLIAEVDPTYFHYYNCYCKSGYYGKPPNCTACSSFGPNAMCPGLSDASGNVDPWDSYYSSGLVFASPGYWASPPIALEEMRQGARFPAAFLPCAFAGTSLSPCRPDDSRLDKACADGYEDRKCSKCSAGYYPNASTCQECPNEATMVVVMFLFFAVFVILSIVAFVNEPASSGPIKVLVFFLQTLSYISVPLESGAATSWTFFSEQFWFSFAHLAPVVKPDCITGVAWSFERSYSIRLALPLMMGFIVLFYVGIAHVLRCFGVLQGLSRRILTRWPHALVFSLYLIYLTVAEAVLTPLFCEEDPGLNESFMSNVPYMQCSVGYTAASSVFLVLYVIGIPFASFALMRHRHRRHLFDFLYVSYRNDKWYWDFIITLRRVVVLVIFLSVSRLSLWQALLVGLLLAFSLFLNTLIQPFSEVSDNYAESISLMILMIVFGIYLRADSKFQGEVAGLVIVLFLLKSAMVAFLVFQIFRRSKPVRWLKGRLSMLHIAGAASRENGSAKDINNDQLSVELLEKMHADKLPLNEVHL
jgi:Leucine-rich repeat (LRR) protein